MKKQFLAVTIIVSMIIFTACKKDATSTVTLNEMVDTTVVTTQKTGNFINGPYGSVSGEAKIFEEKGMFTLALQNMKITNGPDLHVYISKEQLPVNFIDLGKLKSTNGNQVYDIPGMPNFTEYKYVLIHCQQYNHLFGSAVLK